MKRWLLMALITQSMNIAALPSIGQGCPETPTWFSHAEEAIAKDPSRVALSYLRLMEERAFKAAFVLLTPEFAHASDRKAFQDTYVKRKDWHTYADTVCTITPGGNRKQEVRVKAFVANEGYFTLDQITFELISSGERWLIDKTEWKTVIPDVSIPVQDMRFDVQAARKDPAAKLDDLYLIQLQALGWLSKEGASVVAMPPPWLGRLPDNNPADAVQGYISAVACGNACWALYYHADPEEALRAAANPETRDVRVYFESSADHDVDLRDDGTATVWTKVWFSEEDTIVIQAVRFECIWVNDVWKIQDMSGGPRSYIVAGDFGDVCRVSPKVETER